MNHTPRAIWSRVRAFTHTASKPTPQYNQLLSCYHVQTSSRAVGEVVLPRAAQGPGQYCMLLCRCVLVHIIPHLCMSRHARSGAPPAYRSSCSPMLSSDGAGDCNVSPKPGRTCLAAMSPSTMPARFAPCAFCQTSSRRSCLQGGTGKGHERHERPAAGATGIPVDLQRSQSGVPVAVKEPHLRHLRQRAVLSGV